MSPDQWIDVCVATGDGARPGHGGIGGGHWHSCGVGHLNDGEPSSRDCAALRSTDVPLRERTALDLNLRRERTRLGALHFSHGYRARFSVEDIAREAFRRSPSAEILQAVIDANRAFPACADLRVLVSWVHTPVCDGHASGFRIDGPETMRCASLDAECGRGVYDESAECCGARFAIPGLVCDGGAGVCDGAGRCVEPASVPARATGVESWVEFLPRTDGSNYSEFISDDLAGQVAVLEDLVPIAAARIDDVGFTPGLGGGAERRVAIVRRTDSVRLTALGGLEAGTTRTIFYQLSASPIVPIDSEADLEREVPTVAVGNLLVFAGNLDTLPTVLSDGSSPGTVTLPCPGAAGGFTCALDATGRAVISGVNLALVWEPTEVTFDILAGLPGIIVAIDGPFGGGPGGSSGGGTSCGPCSPVVGPLGNTCARARLCTGVGPGVCAIRGYETCNGIDDDCDGVVDDGASASCNDGVPCTVDRCVAMRPGGAGPGCVFDALLGSGSCRARTCDIGVCLGVSILGSPPPIAAGDLITPGAPNPNGCQRVLRNTWCRNSWDSCVCNGAVEMCAPGVSPNTNGCLPAPNCGTPLGGSLTQPNNPCDTDGNFCSVERICIEPDTNCRVLRTLPPADAAAIVAAGAACPSPVCTRPPGLGGPVCAPAPPAALGLNLPCRNDGVACTSDVGVCVSLGCTCGAPTNLPTGAQVVPPGEPIAATFSFLDGWTVTDSGVGCTGVGCSVTSCTAGVCATTPAGCFIAGACFPVGATNPSDVCLVCDPTRSTTAWSGTRSQRTCTHVNPCVAFATCDGNPNPFPTGTCVPRTLHPAGTMCDPTTSCVINTTCDGAGSCTGGSCDVSNDACAEFCS